ncbi:MAG: hypothetical protein ACYC66_18405 [Chloroflexota bacterium]
MVRQDEPSYTDLVYEVLRSAGRPLTFQEIFDEVNRLRPVTSRNPKSTIRNALTQGRQLISLGDGRYGYLPHLLEGSLIRQPLTEKKPANHPLIHPPEVLHALWPSFFENQKRKTERPAQLRLPTGDEVALPLGFLGHGVWGSPMPEGLRRYLVENRAAAGDSLLIRVVDGEAGRCEAWFEPRARRNEVAVTGRNREVADVASQLLRKARRHQLFVWEIAVALLARGVYHADVAPDPLETTLEADRLFVDAGMEMWTLAEFVTPEVQAAIRRMKEMESELFAPPAETPGAFAEAPSPMASRYAMERTMADVGSILSEKEFGSIEEANAYLQEVMSRGGAPHREPETPLEKAQELMYDAWESPDPRERVRLAKRALQLSPDCADAYVLLAEESARSAREAADLYAKGVAAGERALGKNTFQEDAGHFWGILETRPYMRARFGLAQALWAMGKHQEAIQHAWEMLRLNPNDNQGVRDPLLAWLLETGDDAQAKKLLNLYPKDASAMWSYGRALLAFRTEGDTKRARKLLAEAKRGNRHVPAYLLGRKGLPRELPETIGFGDEDEAVACTVEQMAAWHKTPGALAWLAEREQAPTTPIDAL